MYSDTSTRAEADMSATAAPHRRSRRAIALTWLRKTHLYLGLWGALLGLLFGATGFLLNHRAILAIPVQKTVQTSVQLTLPAQRPGSAQELAGWLQQELRFQPTQITQVKSQPTRTVVWGDRELSQPERWNVSLHSPQRGVNAEYFVGNSFVRLDQIDATVLGTLTRLHMSVGVSAFWVLLSDTIAGALILLSVTGLLLWTQLHTVRTLAVCTSLGALMIGLVTALSSLI
ncbi:MAG: PepSY-associated TM helix domain-containing protein [Burkholderiales bacterium]|nr:PepSY-associated TM helix domain-containing protein [Burkholderiales bacterium]